MGIIKYITIFLIFSVFRINSYTQSLRWVELPNSPYTSWRYDDIFFVNAYTGWAVYNTSFASNQGYVYKTTNGGFNWLLQYQTTAYLRAVGFADSLNGWIGIYDTTIGIHKPLIQTTDGGTIWLIVSNITGPVPKGLCGISVVNQSVIYACGRIETPAYVIKTTNGGMNWLSIDMSGLVSCLVDCNFSSVDSGFVVGGTGIYPNQRAKILFTSNGGLNWVVKYESAVIDASCWKIGMAPNIVYASLNYTGMQLQFLKSTNAGNNWIKTIYNVGGNGYFTQGIGFLNSSSGWLGGSINSYETTDGGITWYISDIMHNVNRVRFVNDTLGYAVGRKIYKYTADQSIGINNNNTSFPADYDLDQNYPNPFNPMTSIKFYVPKFSRIKIIIFDVLGNEVLVLLNNYLSGGPYQIMWNGRDKDNNEVSSGVYFYRLETEKFIETKKMVLIR